MSSWVHRYPLFAYFVLAYACTWIVAVPLALQSQGMLAAGLPLALHYLSAFGPAIAAVTVARLLRRSDGGGRRAGQPAAPARPTAWIVVGLVSPLLLFVVAQLVARLAGQSAPTWIALGRVNFLPDLGLAAWPLWFVTNGCGEELGWRGFALPRLQRSHSALVSSCLLAIGWAGWHLPAFFYVPSYAAIGLRILPGFFLGLLAGSIVLTWLYNSSGGSVLAAVLWHASFNYVTASPSASGIAAAVTSTLVMVWAVVILVLYRTPSLASGPKHMTPRGVLAADDP